MEYAHANSTPDRQPGPESTSAMSVAGGARGLPGMPPPPGVSGDALRQYAREQAEAYAAAQVDAIDWKEVGKQRKQVRREYKRDMPKDDAMGFHAAQLARYDEEPYNAAERQRVGATAFSSYLQQAQGYLGPELAQSLSEEGPQSLTAIASTVDMVPTDAPPAPDEGVAVDAIGIVARTGNPELRVRSTPTTSGDNIIGALPFNTHVQVIRRLPGDWLYVSSPSGVIGYVAAMHIWSTPDHPLPEPGARLHRVADGASAIGIAETYFEDVSDDWGQDLRFYVNVIASINGVDAGTDWENVHFDAEDYIWIPSLAYARGMKGQVDSGSFTYEAADALGVAGAVERVGQLIDDLGLAIRLSSEHIPGAVARHVTESLVAVIESLMLVAVGAVGLLAVTTAIGAAIGALGGGVGAAPGAAAGFEVGIALLEWLGLGFLVVWLADAMVRVGSAFGTFFSTVWGANGDRGKIETASMQFAEAIGTLSGVLLEALVMWAASIGVAKAVSGLKGTAIGRAFGESKLGSWLTDRVGRVNAGESKLDSPGTTWRKYRERREASEKGVRIESKVEDQMETLAIAKELPPRYVELMERVRAPDRAGVGAAEVAAGEISIMDLAILTKHHPRSAEFALVELQGGKHMLVEMASYKGGELPVETTKLLAHSHPPDHGSGVAKWISKSDIDALVAFKQSESFMITTDGTVYRFTQSTRPNSIGEVVQRLHPVLGLVDAAGTPIPPVVP